MSKELTKEDYEEWLNWLWTESLRQGYYNWLSAQAEIKLKTEFMKYDMNKIEKRNWEHAINCLNDANCVEGEQ